MGGSVIQDWVNKQQNSKYKQWNIIGLSLMGSTIERKFISIQDDGTSKIDFSMPVLTVSGELDGLMRISRVAEQFYHTNKNINQDQKDQFFVSIVAGLNHAQYSQRPHPVFILENDLMSELEDNDALLAISGQVIPFLLKLTKDDGSEF
jgi:hypothetical protein